MKNLITIIISVLAIAVLASCDEISDTQHQIDELLVAEPEIEAADILFQQAVEEPVPYVESEAIDEPTETALIAVSHEIPSSELYIMGFFTENSQQPFYFIPDEDAISILASYLDDALASEGLPEYAIRGFGTPLGYFVVYNGIQWEVRSHGILMSYDSALADYVMIYSTEATDILQEMMSDIGIVPFNPYFAFGNIVSVKIEKRNTGVDGFYDVTITDASKIADIEAILSNLEVYESSCPFNDVYMTLALSNGDEILLAMASDGCNAFFINGQTFAFRVGGDGFWYSYFTDHLPTASSDRG